MNQLHAHAEEVQTTASPHIPYLLFLRGDIEHNISKLTEAVSDANQLVAETKKGLEKDIEEMQTIKEQARRAAGEAGAAVFTERFASEADENKKDAKPWLKVTAGFAALTIVTAIIMWALVYFKAPPVGSEFTILGTKLAILGVLFTATIWSGRMYKALIHQSVLNRHKALGLQTFQAFSAAADDPVTKDAVLIETTRAIFSPPSTGMFDGAKEGPDGATTIIETIKSASSKD